MRFRTLLILGIALVGLVSTAAVDVVRLKGEASLSGAILLETPERVVIDLGFTALVVPREDVVEVVRGASGVDMEAASDGVDAVESAASVGLYSEASPKAAPKLVRELVSRLGEAVVQVRTPGGLGSGFVVNEEGYLITNFHVIEGETEISVELYRQRDGRLERESYRDVRIVAMNKFADLALLKIEDEDAGVLSHVVLGKSDALDVGETVFAIGSPLGLERTVTEGILSTKTRQIQGALYLQTNTQINPGNSGGPLFDLRGAVVGVTNMKMNFAEGLAFAIPVETVKHFLDHKEAYAYDTDNPSNPYRYLPPPAPPAARAL